MKEISPRWRKRKNVCKAVFAKVFLLASRVLFAPRRSSRERCVVHGLEKTKPKLMMIKIISWKVGERTQLFAKVLGFQWQKFFVCFDGCARHFGHVKVVMRGKWHACKDERAAKNRKFSSSHTPVHFEWKLTRIATWKISGFGRLRSGKVFRLGGLENFARGSKTADVYKLLIISVKTSPIFEYIDQNQNKEQSSYTVYTQSPRRVCF